MSNSVIGNSKIGEYCEDTYDGVEIQDEETDEVYEVTMTGDYVTEWTTVGYQFTCPANSNGTKATLTFYYRRPQSEYYWDVNYGCDNEPIYPILSTVNSTIGALETVLNTTCTPIVLAGKEDGWYSVDVSLKRKLVKGEKLFFGFFSALFCPVWSDSYKTVEAPYCCELYINYRQYDNHKDDISGYILSGGFSADAKQCAAKGDYSLYLSYENEPESVAYEISLVGAVPISAKTFRKEVFKRIGLSKVLSVASWKKKICFYRVNKINAKVQSKNSKKEVFKRSGDGKILPVDFWKKKICFTRANKNEVDFQGETKKSIKTFTRLVDDISVSTLHFVARFFYRVCKTVFSLWDYIKGKIRECNNIVTLYCPIDLEIEIETHI